MDKDIIKFKNFYQNYDNVVTSLIHFLNLDTELTLYLLGNCVSWKHIVQASSYFLYNRQYDVLNKIINCHLDNLYVYDAISAIPRENNKKSLSKYWAIHLGKTRKEFRNYRTFLKDNFDYNYHESIYEYLERHENNYDLKTSAFQLMIDPKNQHALCVWNNYLTWAKKIIKNTNTILNFSMHISYDPYDPYLSFVSLETYLLNCFALSIIADRDWTKISSNYKDIVNVRYSIKFFSQENDNNIQPLNFDRFIAFLKKKNP